MCIGTSPDCSYVPVAASTSGSTSQLFSGLAQGNYYQFKVQALNAIGYSPSSPPHLVVAADPPSQPDSPQKNQELTSQTQIAVSWTEPIDTRGSPVTHYTLQWKLKTAGDYTN